MSKLEILDKIAGLIDALMVTVAAPARSADPHHKLAQLRRMLGRISPHTDGFTYEHCSVAKIMAANLKGKITPQKLTAARAVIGILRKDRLTLGDISDACEMLEQRLFIN